MFAKQHQPTQFCCVCQHVEKSCFETSLFHQQQTNGDTLYEQECLRNNVVYFDQQMGTLHKFCCSKLSFKCFIVFSITNWKKKKTHEKSRKIHKKVYQHLGATLKCWLAPKEWMTSLKKSGSPKVTAVAQLHSQRGRNSKNSYPKKPC